MTDQHDRILYLIVLLAVVAGGFTFRRTSMDKKLRYGMIWLAIMVGLALFYNLLLSISG